jgi:3-isopropylmalate/(R)-2-methylmalate dehydratase small subunit
VTAVVARGPVSRVEGVAVALMRDNVDTDAIMPSAGVRAAGTDVAALAQYLFHEWRGDARTRESSTFPLDRPESRGARILVSGHNFGCGSSREHAVWALKGHGIEAVVAGSFGEIFAGNCARNGVVAACVADHHLRRLADAVVALAGTAPIVVDLESMSIAAPGCDPIAFTLDPGAREMLLSGRDEIDATRALLPSIRAFQRRHAERCPWVYACGPGTGP